MPYTGCSTHYDPRDLADLKTRIISAVKNIDAPMLTRAWQELEYPIDVYRVAVSPVVHTPNISSYQKTAFSVFLWL
jgi:hypothetical protein